MPDAVYVLPLRRAAVDAHDLADLATYLRTTAGVLPVVVADASPPAVRAAHVHAFGPTVRVLAVPPPGAGLNGKVVGVLAGLAATTVPHVVVADDDVRWSPAALDAALAALEEADLVVPQNVFDPMPWHARWDTARSLLNRALGHDYAGTVVLRRAALGPGGYDARVLFENLELERTVRARGGVVEHLRDLAVPRRPPDVRRFVEQRVRQAYDSLAQPPRLAAELCLLPVLVAGLVAGTRAHRAARRAGRALLVLAAVLAVALAEVGRRRDGGADVFPRSAALWAPAWVVERAVCSWIAVGWWALGGVPYAGTRLRRAAHTVEELRRGARPGTVEGERA